MEKDRSHRNDLRTWLVAEAEEVRAATVPSEEVVELFDVLGLVAMRLRELKDAHPALDLPSLYEHWGQKQLDKGRAQTDPAYRVYAAATDARGRF